MKFEKRKESVAEFARRLREKFKTLEWRARKREENLIREWKYGKRKPGKKPSDGSKEFKSPKD